MIYSDYSLIFNFLPSINTNGYRNIIEDSTGSSAAGIMEAAGADDDRGCDSSWFICIGF